MDRIFVENAIIAYIKILQTDKDYPYLADLISSMISAAEKGEGLPALFPPEGIATRFEAAVAKGLRDIRTAIEHEIVRSSHPDPVVFREEFRSGLTRELVKILNLEERPPVADEAERERQRLSYAKDWAAFHYLFAPESRDVPALASYAVSSRAVDNVVGVGIGEKSMDGRATPCVRIYVANKLPDPAIAPEDRLPEEIQGFPVDVIQSGRLVALARFRPSLPGHSIGVNYRESRFRTFSATGTLGALVTKEGRTFLLSNNHVLAAENRQPIGGVVLQPGPADGGVDGRDRIASLSEFVPLDPSVKNEMDAALAEVEDPSQIERAFADPIGCLSSSIPLAPSLGMEVEKVGRTTGHRVGKVGSGSV